MRPSRSAAVLRFVLLLTSAAPAFAGVTLLVEEPFGKFGGLTPTGHSAVYFSRICAAAPTVLRRCHEGEYGVVLSRYHRVSGFDWLAIPVLPYLYAVDRPDEVPAAVDAEKVAELRDAYRRANLSYIVPDAENGRAPEGDWIQLIGGAYDRTIFAFGVETTEAEDDALLERFNSRPNRTHFNLLFYNCADFVRNAIDFYYPHAIHRSFFSDLGIMTPKQAARSFLQYSRKHEQLRTSVFVIPQIPGRPRSTAVRGVLESFVKSKKYAVPLASAAVLDPYLGGGMAFAWLGSRFDPRRVAAAAHSTSNPAEIVVELQTDHAIHDGP